MSLKELLQQILILLYLLITLSALLFTAFRLQVPLIPQGLAALSYQMMAPYQGYDTTNADLRAEGQLQNGEWHVIDTAPYFPLNRPREILRKRLVFYKRKDDALVRQKYTELALQLLRKEQEKGANYTALRLTWQTWPMSPQGFDAMKREAMITNYFLAQVP